MSLSQTSSPELGFVPSKGRIAPKDKSASMAWTPSAVMIAIVLVSFRPFESDPSKVGIVKGGGDILNQLGFGIMGIFCVFLLVLHTSRENLNAYKSFLWFLVALVVGYSILNADSPNSALRAVLFSLIVVLVAMTSMALPRTMKDMVDALGIGIMIALVFCYFAVFFVPEQGVHQGGGFESQHSGLWRGVYDHKNAASYVMGAFSMIGWFVARNGRPVMGTIMTILSVLFVLQAGSKTVLVILPIAFIIASAAQWVSWGPLRGLIVLAPVAVLTLLTLGSVVFPSILEEMRLYSPGLSYTGRTDLWEFGLQYLAETPWTGFGFESFWGTPRVRGLEQPIELSWDVRGIVHGHNSWLDSAIAFGVPGAILIAITLTIVPVRDYLRIPRSGNAGKLAGLFIGMWVFTALGANLESFFFRRNDPVWFAMLIAVIGLRLTAHATRIAAK